MASLSLVVGGRNTAIFVDGVLVAGPIGTLVARSWSSWLSSTLQDTRASSNLGRIFDISSIDHVNQKTEGFNYIGIWPDRAGSSYQGKLRSDALLSRYLTDVLRFHAST